MAISRCNCENLACGHTPSGCTRTALGNNRVEYLGAVCVECWLKYDPKYRINPEGK